MKKLLSALLALSLLTVLCAVSLADSASFAGGTGTQGYPGQFFALTADIDLAGVEWQPIGHMDLSDILNA